MRRKLVRDAVRDLALAGWTPSRMAEVLPLRKSSIYRDLAAIAKDGERLESDRRDLAAALESD